MGNDTPDALDARVGTLEKQVGELFDKVNAAAISSAAVAEKLNSMLIAIGELKQSVKELRERPGRLWDNLVAGGTGAVIGAIVAAAAAHFH